MNTGEENTIIPWQLRKKGLKFVLVKKRSKNAFEKGWPEDKNYDFNEDKLLTHLNRGGNYSVLCGKLNLVVIDFDDEEYYESKKPFIESTFTVKSGGKGLPHVYYFLDKPIKGSKITNSERKILADIQGMYSLVVGPGSIHESGRPYLVVDESEIKSITVDDLYEMFPEMTSNSKKVNPKITIQHSNKIICPFHEDHKPSMMIYEEGNGFCFACNASVTKEALENLSETITIPNKQGGRHYYINNIEKNINSLKNEIFELIIDKKRYQATELIVRYIARKNHIKTIKTDQLPEMYLYSEGIYVPNGETTIKQICRTLLGSAYTTSLANVVISKIQTDTYIDGDEFFTNQNKHKYLIPLENGILNIQKKELTNFSPKIYFFNKLPVKYAADTKCENIIHFFQDILPDKESLKTIQELFGYSLLKEYKFEKSFFFLGEGRNGKSKLLEILRHLLGEQNCASVSLTDIDSKEFSIINLHNRLVNISGDLSKTSLNNTGVFKSLTGRDLIQANRKFQNHLTFENYAKMIFAGNEIPRTNDLSPAFFQRWIIIKFPYTFLSRKDLETNKKPNAKLKNPSIVQELITEKGLSGLLNWSLEGLERLEKNKEFTSVKATADVRKEWIMNSNSFISFCEEHIETDYETKIGKAHLKKVYLNYCRLHKIKPESDKSIRDYITRELGATSLRHRKDSNDLMIWEGIKFVKGDIDDMLFSTLSDFLFFSYSTKTLCQSSQSSRKKDISSNKQLVALFKKKSEYTFEDITKALPFDPKTITKTINQLIAQGDLVEFRSGTYKVRI